MKLPLLIDFDGVLRIENLPAPGIKEFFKFLKSADIYACILSNSSISTSDDIGRFFTRNSIECYLPVLTATDAAFDFVSSKYKKVSIYLSDNVSHLFQDIINNSEPEAVVIGDIGDRWSYEIMMDIFNHVIKGADLVALHKNKFWKPAGGEIMLDAGPFITAIEYATGKEAKLIGKPSPQYFQSALHRLGFSSNQKFIMLGDDLETDIAGAQNMGSEAILIYTGKTKYPLSYDSEIKPDYAAKDLYAVIELLKEIRSV